MVPFTVIHFRLIPGVPEEQAAERRSHPAVQAEKDGDVSDAQQKDQERTAQPEPADGVSASEDPRNGEMTLLSHLILDNYMEKCGPCLYFSST